MSTRCKSCNNRLQDSELTSYNQELGKFEDMCGKCRGMAFEEYNYVWEHQYTLQGTKEGLVQPLSSKY